MTDNIQLGDIQLANRGRPAQHPRHHPMPCRGEAAEAPTIEPDTVGAALVAEDGTATATRVLASQSQLSQVQSSAAPRTHARIA